MESAPKTLLAPCLSVFSLAVACFITSDAEQNEMTESSPKVVVVLLCRGELLHLKRQHVLRLTAQSQRQKNTTFVTNV